VPTGLDYFNARYYSSAQGRFISVDPENAGASLWDPQSWNGYAYVSNNPLAFTDPTGEGIFGDIGFAIGSFIPGVGRLLGWGIGSIADLATGQSISLPGFGIGSAVFGSIAGSMNNGQPWNEQLPSGVGSIGELNTGTVFGSGNVGGMVFSFTDAACNVGYAVVFVKAHAGDAAEVAARLRVPTQNVLGLSAAESRWGLDWNATRTADNGQPARNFFSLQGNAKSPFANGSVLSGKGTRLSAFPSYKAAAQSFEAQYGGLVTGKVTPLDFATALVPRFNSGKAPLGNPNFIRDLVRTIGMTQRRMGCR
jgi:RHS repeat-associated protein